MKTALHKGMIIFSITNKELNQGLECWKNLHVSLIQYLLVISYFIKLWVPWSLMFWHLSHSSLSTGCSPVLQLFQIHYNVNYNQTILYPVTDLEDSEYPTLLSFLYVTTLNLSYWWLRSQDHKDYIFKSTCHMPM